MMEYKNIRNKAIKRTIRSILAAIAVLAIIGIILYLIGMGLMSVLSNYGVDISIFQYVAILFAILVVGFIVAVAIRDKYVEHFNNILLEE